MIDKNSVNTTDYRLITLDFETYYSKEYGLKQFTTEAYIRDYQFQVIGFSYKINDGPCEWVSGWGKDVMDSLDIPNSYLLAHNMAFDGAILAWHYGIKPKFYLDTLSMAKPITGLTVGGSLAALAKKFSLGEKGTEVVNALGKRLKDFSTDELAKYGEYCKNDVQLTYTLYQILKQYSTPKEQYIIDLMLRMYTDPVLQLNEDTLQEHLTKVQTKKQKLMSMIDSSIGRENLMSNPKFAEVLATLGVSPPMKISPRTGKETYAFGKTDTEFKALLEHEDERVQAVVSARLGVKSTLEETRTESFIAIAKRGPLPILLNYYGAHTGRASGGDKINLQNLPRGGSLRKSISAPEGHVVVAVDSAQIEARVVAWLAGQADLVEDFRNGVDIYSKFASDVYGREINKAVDKVERFVGKTCIAEGTLVLSDQGWKPIEAVSLADKLWDGEEWVCHQGLLNNGIKQTLNLCGAWMTPDHQVWSGTQWLEAQSVVADEHILSQALGTGAANLPSQATYEVQGLELNPSLCGATATKLNTLSITITSKILEALGVRFVQKRPQAPNDIGLIQKRYPMTHTVRGCLIDWLLQLPVVTPRLASTISTTGNGALTSTMGGVMTEHRSSNMFNRLVGGIEQTTRWIASTLTGTMNRETYGLCHEATTSETNVKLQTSRRVYDILNCGSRNRFTILTNAGPIIVHNCILGLGYGMGKDKFKQTLKIGQAGVSVDLPIADAERIVNLYRSKYPMIVQLWKEANNALPAMINGYEYEFGTNVKLKCTSEGIALPNGMMVRYPNLSKADDGYTYDSRYGPVKIYGGKVVENVVQALARIVVFNQMAKIDQAFRKKDSKAARFKVVLTVHDEVVAVVPEQVAQKCLDFMTKVMSTPPNWANTLPVACEGDFALTYGDCK